MRLLFLVFLFCLLFSFSGCVAGPGVEPPRAGADEGPDFSFKEGMDAGPSYEPTTASQAGGSGGGTREEETDSLPLDDIADIDDGGSEPADDAGSTEE